jgi:hypothetical protein
MFAISQILIVSVDQVTHQNYVKTLGKPLASTAGVHSGLES